MSEKRHNGSTDLYPLVLFIPRADKRLKRGYLNGVYGAVPTPGDFFALLLSNDEIKRQVLGIFTDEIYKSLREA